MRKRRYSAWFIFSVAVLSMCRLSYGTETWEIGNIDNSPIGQETPAAGGFTTLTTTSTATIGSLTASKPVFTDGSKVLVSTGTLGVDQGGTGATTLTDHGILLGSGTSEVTPLGAATNGQLPIGSTGADPVLAALTEGEAIDVTNGAGSITLACEDASDSNKGVAELATDAEAVTGTDTALVCTPANLTARLAAPGAIGGTTASSGAFTTLSTTSTATIGSLTASKPVFTDGSKMLVSTGTLGVDQGGTGATTLTDHGILLGSGTSEVTPLGAATNGQLPIGSTGADPVLAALTEGDGLDITNGAGTISLAVDLKANGGIVIETGEMAVDLGASAITGTLAAADGGTGATTLTDHGVLVGSATDPITALAVGTNGQVLVGSTGADPVFATITDGEAITTTLGAGTLQIDCEDASDSNKGVAELATDAEAVTGTDTALVCTPANLTARLAAPGAIGGTTASPGTFTNLTVTGGQTVVKVNVADTDYNPSTLTANYIIAFTSLTAARAYTISTEDEDSGTTTQVRTIIVKDESGNAGLYPITITLESGGTIDGAASYALNQPYQSVSLYINGTNAFVF